MVLANLDKLEQCGGDLTAAQEQLQDVEVTLKTQNEEMDALRREQSQVKVSKACPIKHSPAH